MRRSRGHNIRGRRRGLWHLTTRNRTSGCGLGCATAAVGVASGLAAVVGFVAADGAVAEVVELGPLTTRRGIAF